MTKKHTDIKSNKIWSYTFIIGFLSLVVLLNRAMIRIDPIGKSILFNKNDFEKIKLTHPEAIYDKVFYGNSVVISAYIEENSRSGYINMGMDYATIEDLSKILEKQMITIGNDLVIGINYLTFLDTFDTNPTYPWHRKVYEPYLYFHRDKAHKFLTDGINNLLNGEKFINKKYSNLGRSVYRGVLPDEELDKKIERYIELYWDKGIEYYKNNFMALEKIIDFCDINNINLRFIIFPWNDYIEKPQNVINVEKRAKEILDNNDIKYIDLSNEYTREFFHDLGHLNYEYGAVEFTKEIDKWLIQE